MPSLSSTDCRVVCQARVPCDEKRDGQVTPTSFTNIRHIEFEYTWDEADERSVVPQDTSPEVYLDTYLYRQTWLYWPLFLMVLPVPLLRRSQVLLLLTSPQLLDFL